MKDGEVIIAKYSFDNVIEEFSKTNYILLSNESEYINCGKNNIRYICPKHKDKGEMTISLSHLMHGRGCFYCGRERTENAHKINYDANKNKELCELKGLIYVDTLRNNGKISIKFICKEHYSLGEQCATIYNIKRKGKGCKYCAGKQLPKWYVLEEIYKINPYVNILSDFNFLNDYVDVECTKHKYKYNCKVINLMNGHSCYYCGLDKLSKSSTLTIDTVNNNIKKMNPHVKALQYNGASKTSKWLCTKHNVEFNKYYNTLIYCESGCSICYKERMNNMFAIGIDEFKCRLHNIHPELSVISDYKNSSSKIKVHCNKHNYTFYSTPSALLSRTICCCKTKITYKEEYICNILESWGYRITRQKTFDGCKDLRNLPFDIYLDDFNTAVEYQGEQHYRPVTFMGEDITDAVKKMEYTKKHDLIKKKYCKKNEINLIEIPYWKFENVEYYLFDKFVKLNIIEEITNNIQEL